MCICCRIKNKHTLFSPLDCVRPLPINLTIYKEKGAYQSLIHSFFAACKWERIPDSAGVDEGGRGVPDCRQSGPERVLWDRQSGGFLSRAERWRQVGKNEQTRSRITGLRAFILQKKKNGAQNAPNHIDK